MSLGKAILGVVAGALAASVAYLKRDELMEMWDALVISLSGKRVAVLGERHVGKTVLLNFLSKGEIPDEYMQTLLPEKVAARRLALGELKLNLKATRDLPGGHDAVGDWKTLHDEADFVLYLVNAQRVNQQRVRRDLGLLEAWADAAKCPPKLVLIVTHMDMNPSYVSTPPSGMGNFRDLFVKHNLDAGLSQLTARPPILLGSLADENQTAKLVANLIRTVTA